MISPKSSTSVLDAADFSEGGFRRRKLISEKSASAPSKAFNQLGASPDQGNVTALYPTVVTAF
ncbi:MAG: hypothetical protein LW850_32535, partial [Planctomycetaceae bacterium]|nr:hypothetical protein [Planctomycetaceae bacterium]